MPWSGETWRAWVAAVAGGRDHAATASALRHALLGDDDPGEADGPSMKDLLPLIGPARSEARLAPLAPD